jgi:hypothetical protein
MTAPPRPEPQKIKGGGLMVVFTHSRDGELISCQAVSDDELDADEFDQAARLLFEMVYQEEDEQSA